MYYSFFDPFLCVTDWFLVYQQTNWHNDKSHFVFVVRSKAYSVSAILYLHWKIVPIMKL